MIQLDILRGVAITLVLWRHSVMDPRNVGVLSPLARMMSRVGWSGVDLFFVLSGFLIGGLLFSELRERGELDVRRFIVRRGFKIWPNYLLYVAFVWVSIALYHLHDPSFGRFASLRIMLPNLLHLQNYFGTPRGHTWSLAVEEHFYLLLPLALVFFSKRAKVRESIPQFIPMAIAAFVLCLIGRIIMVRLRGSADYFSYLTPTHLRIDGLLFGVLLAYCHHYHPEIMSRIRNNWMTILFLGLILVSPIAIFKLEKSFFLPTFGFTMGYVGFGCILLAIVYAPPAGNLCATFVGSSAGKLLAFIGYYSYAIYLWHMDLANVPISFLVENGYFGSMPPAAMWMVSTAIYMIVAVATAVLVTRIVEQPALALRDRVFPARARALGDLQTAASPAPVEKVISFVSLLDPAPITAPEQA